METKDIYTLKIIKDGVITIQKDYCYLNKFDFKKNSSVLFLLSAEKLKKMTEITKEEYNQYLWNYNKIITELKNIVR